MESLINNIYEWLEESYNTDKLHVWVDNEKFFEQLVEDVISEIKHSGFNERNININIHSLYPLVSNEYMPSNILIYTVPDSHMEYVNSIRQPYKVVRVDVN